MTLEEVVVPFTARDGYPCNLVRYSDPNLPSERGPVLLIPGSGVRANLFKPPNNQNLVEYLVANGFDVWAENWRASIDFVPSQWTLDDAAVNDHPAAVDKVLEVTQQPSLKAVVHCQGSTSFMLAAIAGLFEDKVTRVVSNAVSLHPVLPTGARVKMEVLLKIAPRLFPYLDPQWAVNPQTRVRTRAMVLWVRLRHRECGNIVCRMSSCCYGRGFPTLWRHENLNEDTHQWLSKEFSWVPKSFFKQINRSAREQRLLATNRYPELPTDIVSKPPRHGNMRFAFIVGARNACFEPVSQRKTFEMFEALQPGKHAYHEFLNYAHLDIFLGEHAARDIYPTILQELK